MYFLPKRSLTAHFLTGINPNLNSVNGCCLAPLAGLQRSAFLKLAPQSFSQPSNMASKAIKFSPALKELRIHLCQKSEASQGVRDFIEKYYVSLKQQNPKFPILIRECSGVQPRLWARYDGGRESSIPLTKLKAEEVLQNVSLVSKHA